MALTLIEVLVLIGIIGIVIAVVLVNNARSRPRLTIPLCRFHLHQIGEAMSEFAADHDGKFPQRVSTNDGGSMEFNTEGSPAIHFQVLSNYYYPRLSEEWLLSCPADTLKKPPRDHLSHYENHNISYFISVDASQSVPNAILAGDRNLRVAGQTVRPGLFVLRTNVSVGWTRELHGKSAGTPCGNILFSDGHVETLWSDVTGVVGRQGLSTNRIAVP